MDYISFSFMLLFNISILLFSENGLAVVKIIERKNNSLAHDWTQNFKTRLLNTTQKRNSSTIPSQLKTSKNWQIGRVTKRQYEIINLLWQKTKIFVDLNYSNSTCKATTIDVTADSKKNLPLHSKHNYSKSSVFRAKLPSSTPSYIEFYYSDYGDDSENPKLPPNLILEKLKNNARSIRKNSSPSSLLGIRVNAGPYTRYYTKPRQEKSIHNSCQSNIVVTTIKRPSYENYITKSPLPDKWKSIQGNDYQSYSFALQQKLNIIPIDMLVSTVSKRNSNESLTTNYKLSLDLYPNDLIYGKNDNIQDSWISVSKSTVYDKVKFFEMYDSNTPEYHNYNKINISNKVADRDIKKTGSIRDNNQILLQDVNTDTGYQRSQNETRRDIKKHIIQDFNIKEKKSFTFFNRNDFKISSRKNVPKSSPFQKQSNGSRIVFWAEYPFVAVYIYEPLQVRCDAASISPHWLVAAASCLYRYQRELHGGSLSAFVTFCGDSWRQPQRITYVKRSVIHPRYHPKDRMRRQLYNAGVIQVVNSMSDTCGGWAPVSLMSHKFSSGQEGSIATAVGWGFDRYKKLYTAVDIPSHSLMAYESLLYSESCPGKLKEYSAEKAFDEDGTTNLYCLLLPPYVAEENDTVHGGLLLIGGKLLALYLQEERRPWGLQSAQYTGVWRLVPWIAETAREPEDYLFQSLI